jgi:hypothetical protein
LYAYFISRVYSTWPSFLILLDLITLIIFGEDKLWSSFYAVFSILLSFRLLGPNSLVSILFSNTLNPSVFFSQVERPISTHIKQQVKLCVCLIFGFLGRKQKEVCYVVIVLYLTVCIVK